MVQGWLAGFLRLLQVLSFYDNQNTEMEGKVCESGLPSLGANSGQQQNQD